MLKTPRTTFAGLLNLLFSKRPFSLVTLAGALIFGLLYAIEDQIVLFGFNVAKPAGVSLPLQVIIFGPEPMQGPPQVAYYVTVLGNFGMIQINLSGVMIAAILALLFGINISIVIFLKSIAGKSGRKSFASLLSILPGLVSTSGCCCCAPLFLLLLGEVAADSLGFMLLPFFSVFVYASIALLVFNIYYFGSKACHGNNGAFMCQLDLKKS